jgi:lipid A disaccharide synthetase
LILNQSAVPELIQEECTIENMQNALAGLLPGQPQRAAQLANYTQLQNLLKQSGVSERIAHSMNYYLLS